MGSGVPPSDQGRGRRINWRTVVAAGVDVHRDRGGDVPQREVRHVLFAATPAVRRPRGNGQALAVAVAGLTSTAASCASVTPRWFTTCISCARSSAIRPHWQTSASGSGAGTLSACSESGSGEHSQMASDVPENRRSQGCVDSTAQVSSRSSQAPTPGPHETCHRRLMMSSEQRRASAAAYMSCRARGSSWRKCPRTAS